MWRLQSNRHPFTANTDDGMINSRGKDVSMTYWVIWAAQLALRIIVPHLMHWLSDKGLYPVAIPNLIEAILEMEPENWHFTLEEMNRELAREGWKLDVDPITIELILSLLEGKGE